MKIFGIIATLLSINSVSATVIPQTNETQFKDLPYDVLSRAVSFISKPDKMKLAEISHLFKNLTLIDNTAFKNLANKNMSYACGAEEYFKIKNSGYSILRDSFSRNLHQNSPAELIQRTQCILGVAAFMQSGEVHNVNSLSIAIPSEFSFLEFPMHVDNYLNALETIFSNPYAYERITLTRSIGRVYVSNYLAEAVILNFLSTVQIKSLVFDTKMHSSYFANHIP